MCVRERGHPSSPPRGCQQSTARPARRHAGVVSAHHGSTGERLCGGDVNVLEEELEPLLFTALLLRVPEAFGCYISLHSARSACLGQVG